MRFIFSVLFLVMLSCGNQSEKFTNGPNTQTSQLASINSAILQLSGTQAMINALVTSDYSTCTSTPTQGGQTNNALIQKICQIAQASTSESSAETKDELSASLTSLSQSLTAQVNSLQSQVSAVSVANDWQIPVYGADGLTPSTAINPSIWYSINTMNTSISTLQTQMTSANAAITAIQAQLSSLSTTVAGAMVPLIIGIENALAGPLYETVLRKSDRSVITGYIQQFGTSKSLVANPLATTNGSKNVVVTWASNGLAVGNVVSLSYLTPANGLLSSDVNGTVTVTAVATNTFTYVSATAATATGSVGGSVGIAQQIQGLGLGTFWTTSSGEVSATTTLDTLPYNFLVTGSSTTFTASPTGAALPTEWAGLTPGAGFLCYSSTTPGAIHMRLLKLGLIEEE